MKLLTYLLLLAFCPPLFASAPSAAKKRISVIINPISGGVDKRDIADRICDKLDKSRFEIEILYTQAPHHATKLAREALQRHVEIIVAVGGDGSVNEVSQSLVGTKAILAIIPTGSGNGLAHHLHIPLDIDKAIDLINTGRVVKIDTVRINDKYCLGIAGIGFDAEVGWAFSNFGYRGFLSYLLLTLKELPTYEPYVYHMWVDGKRLSREAFLLTFANGSQFGNDACIAPTAQINDGYLDLIIMKKFPFYATPQVVHQLFDRSLDRSKYVEIIKCKEIRISQPQLKGHIDGEPVFFESGLHLRIIPSSLRVLVPSA